MFSFNSANYLRRNIRLSVALALLLIAIGLIVGDKLSFIARATAGKWNQTNSVITRPDANRHFDPMFVNPALSGCADETWTAMSTASAPAAREAHTAVWTGSEMIVWGGTGSHGSLNTGGRYNPATDTWAPVSTTNAPSARYYDTAVWTGTEMLIWGDTLTAPHPYRWRYSWCLRHEWWFSSRYRI